MAKFLFIDFTPVVNYTFSPMSCFQCTVYFSMLGAQILMCVTVRICLFPFFVGVLSFLSFFLTVYFNRCTPDHFSTPKLISVPQLLLVMIAYEFRSSSLMGGDFNVGRLLCQLRPIKYCNIYICKFVCCFVWV
jgi:hypothetical protein